MLTTTHISSHSSGFEPHRFNPAIEKLVGESPDSDYNELDSTIVGQAPAMVEVKRQILKLGRTDLAVLICGETGTGKDLVARGIHRFSPRMYKPFIKVNTPGLPATLFESELFGFERGAFTGAFRKKPGKFELANSGTIFLDEISSVPLPLQAKLLEVSEDKAYSPLGSISKTQVDVRVLAATNANLNEMVSQRRFRLDLYHRICAISIHIPPLRERKEDIDLLCDHFLKKHAARYRKAYRPLSDHMREAFHAYSWPGNVRELENDIQTMIVTESEKMFQEKFRNHIFSADQGTGTAPMMTAKGETIGALELLKKYTLKELSRRAAQKAESNAIMDVLSYTDGNRKQAARLLKISYRALLYKIKEFGLGPEEPALSIRPGERATCSEKTRGMIDLIKAFDRLVLSSN
jgi:two-component system response regulator AtoC